MENVKNKRICTILKLESQQAAGERGQMVGKRYCDVAIDLK
jgi:hypothetical protein